MPKYFQLFCIAAFFTANGYQSEAQVKKYNTKSKKINLKTKLESVTKSSDKLIIYQITAHLWGNKKSNNKVNGSEIENGCGKFADLNDTALKAIKDFGYTHIWVMSILENATLVDHSSIGIPNDHPAVVKGRAGSPFAVKDYYDVNPNLAIDPLNRMAEFEAMRDRIHQHGLKLIMDFIPNHVARQYHSDAMPSGIENFGAKDNQSVIFDAQNNFYYLPGTEFIVPQGVIPAIQQNSFYEEKPAKVTGNDVFKAEPNINDWFETIKLNYGVNILNNRSNHFDPVPNTWLKMTDILSYWTAKGVDGFRCDMAEMVPVEFWAYAISRTKKQNPAIKFIAEIYNPKEYKNYVKSGGFDYLYDKVGLYDALRRLIENQPNANVADITKVWQEESGDISEHMLRFLENHDEQRIASDFFAKDPEKAKAAMVLSSTLHNGPLMLFFGQELGEPSMDAEGFGSKDGRTTMFDFWGIKSHQAWMNGGKFDGALLTEKQKSLQNFYKSLINFTKNNSAVNDGQFYDLQYANHYPKAEKKKIYSYLRYSEGQKLLFIYNFNQQKAFKTTVTIPDEAFKAANIKNKSQSLSDIFLNKTTKTKMVEGEINIDLAPNSVYIFELK
ncbi:MAG: alpha-amylase family protein [Bacteroidota bacterium]